MFTVKVQGNISVLPTPPSNPESLLEGPFSTFAEFEKNLREFEKATFAVFRKNNTVSVQTARKYLKHTMPEDIVYHRAQFVCTHFGKPRYRGKGVINHSTTLATGCEAELVLLWNNHVRKLLVTKRNLKHNHAVNAFTYSQQYKVKRLTNEQKEEVKELIKKNIKMKGSRLRDFINSQYNKCFSLRDASLLKHQLKKAMTPKEIEFLSNGNNAASNQTYLGESSLEVTKKSTFGQVPSLDTKGGIKMAEAAQHKPNTRRSQPPPVFPDVTNVTDVSQFVSYLEASNRLKRRGEDTQRADLLQSSFMIRRPNILSVKRRRTEARDGPPEAPAAGANQTKDRKVTALPKVESLIENKEVGIVKRFAEDKELRIVVLKNISDSDTDNKDDVVVYKNVSDTDNKDDVVVYKNISDPDNKDDIVVHKNISDTHISGDKDDVVAPRSVADGTTSSKLQHTRTSGDNNVNTRASRDVAVPTAATVDGQSSRNFHFFMDLCHQVDTLNPKTALRARQELGRIVHKYMMAEID